MDIVAGKKARKQINLRLETELYDFLVAYARQNYKTVTAVVREMIADLYRGRSTQPTPKDQQQ